MACMTHTSLSALVWCIFRHHEGVIDREIQSHSRRRFGFDKQHVNRVYYMTWLQAPMWRNWQTRYVQGVVRVTS